MQASSSDESVTSDCSNDDDCIRPVLAEDVAQTAIINWLAECPKVPLLTVSKLLGHFKEFYSDFPKTACTLLKSDDMDVSVDSMLHGRYVHFNNWTSIVAEHLGKSDFSGNHLGLNINIDGVPLFKDSRRFHAHPILVRLCTAEGKIVCAGIYVSENSGVKKPSTMPDVNDLCRKFVDDMLLLCSTGIMYKNRHVTVGINAFICDRIARSDLKKMIGHSGLNSCERCKQRGKKLNNHVVLLKTDCELRTDEDYINQTDPGHHRAGEPSILANLDIGLVSSFTLDYMHLICLGVCKRLLMRLKVSKHYHKKMHLSAVQIDALDASIAVVANALPSTFSRRLFGGVNHIKNWKASEFRCFLLYVGVIVLKDHVSSEQYVNFLYLSIATRLLLSPDQESNMPSVKKLLLNFVHSSRKLYGDDFIAGNVHSLIHLTEDYYKWGPLDRVSCFEFESYLGSIVKGRLTGRNKPVEQLMRHITIQNQKDVVPKRLPLKVIPFGETFLKPRMSHGRDNCVLLKSGDICIVNSKVDEGLRVTKLGKKSDLFQAPLSSGKVGIYKVLPGICISVVKIEEIKCKILLAPTSNGYIASKLIHM